MDEQEDADRKREDYYESTYSFTEHYSVSAMFYMIMLLATYRTGSSSQYLECDYEWLCHRSAGGCYENFLLPL